MTANFRNKYSISLIINYFINELWYFLLERSRVTQDVTYNGKQNVSLIAVAKSLYCSTDCYSVANLYAPIACGITWYYLWKTWTTTTTTNNVNIIWNIVKFVLYNRHLKNRLKHEVSNNTRCIVKRMKQINEKFYFYF